MTTKVCAMCKEEKSIEDFNSKKNKSGESKKQPYCKICNKIYHKEHYRKNKQVYLKKNKEQIRQNKEKMLVYLKKQKCVDCGTTDYRVFEFDHLKDKEYSISSRAKYLSWETLKKEIDKCEIVCCNCHRIRTLQRANSYRIS